MDDISELLSQFVENQCLSWIRCKLSGSSSIAGAGSPRLLLDMLEAVLSSSLPFKSLEKASLSRELLDRLDRVVLSSALSLSSKSPNSFCSLTVSFPPDSFNSTVCGPLSERCESIVRESVSDRLESTVSGSVSVC